MQIQRSLPPSMAANVFAMRYGSVFGLLLALTLGVTAPARAAYDTTYLMGLLQSTPDGGWVKINTNKYPDAWPTGSVASPNVPSGPASIVYSWSSFGWDSNNGYLTLFGGGHANYIGNEVYRVSAATGLWERGSLSSKTDQSTWAVVDGLAPQSSHTWDNNIFLPVNNRFVTFGGAVAGPGGPFFTLNASGTPVPAGPWAWDPTKADPNKVGGSSGSGWDPSTPGGNMWTNLVNMNTGGQPPRFGLGATAYANENGKDVVYVSTEAVASGFPKLYRYELGDVAAGGLATWQQVGTTGNSVTFEGAAAIDGTNHLFARTTFSGLAVWDLDNNNPTNPTSNKDVAVTLRLPNGTPLTMTNAGGDIDFGIAFKSLLDCVFYRGCLGR